jgi:hypothetical protein
MIFASMSGKAARIRLIAPRWSTYMTNVKGAVGDLQDQADPHRQVVKDSGPVLLRLSAWIREATTLSDRRVLGDGNSGV